MSQSDLRNKVTKEFPEFASEVAGLTDEQIDARLAQLSKDDNENDVTKENDEEYLAAKALVAEMGAPYRELRKVIRMKSKYLISLLQDRGKE